MIELNRIDRQNFYKALLGGFVIGLGGIGYLTIDNGYLGAFLFSLGLCTILTFKWRLFTGVLCTQEDLIDYLIAYIGNFIGAFITAVLYYFIYGFTLGKTIAKSVLTPKYDKGLFRIIFAGVMCEVCIYIAVAGFKRAKSDAGRYLLTIMAVMMFVLCGFEHSIANIFYTVVYVPSLWKFIVINLGSVLGNILGAIFIRILVKLTR